MVSPQGLKEQALSIAEPSWEKELVTLFMLGLAARAVHQTHYFDHASAVG